MSKEERLRTKVITNNACGGTYFVAFVGAAVYFVSHANGFWEVMLAFLKSCVWPAFVVYHVLSLLHA